MNTRTKFKLDGEALKSLIQDYYAGFTAVKNKFKVGDKIAGLSINKNDITGTIEYIDSSKDYPYWVIDNKGFRWYLGNDATLITKSRQVYYDTETSVLKTINFNSKEKQMKKTQEKKDHAHILIELSWTDKYGHFHDAWIHKSYRSHDAGVKAADRLHRKTEGEHGYFAVIEQRILGQ